VRRSGGITSPLTGDAKATAAATASDTGRDEMKNLFSKLAPSSCR
jgi:hypothetical protein